jgi:type I restriction enzyme S subunit
MRSLGVRDMDSGLKPYPGYKKTGLLWLDSVPEHWEIKANKALWAERKIVNIIDKPLLSVTIKRGVIQQSELLKSSSKKDSSNLDKSKYKLVEPNDIVYNKMRMWQGAVGASKYEGIVSPAYIVLKPINNVNHRYYHYLLRTPNYIEESHRNSYGICDDQLSLRYEEFKCMQSLIPPKEEQDQIVRYLDSKLAKINKYIKNKKKLVELLKEQKQAIINQAVTKGLDPNAKMKPSGIEWLGDIPEGWEVRRLKTVVRNIANTTTKKENDEIYIGLENVDSWSGRIINVSIESVFDSQAKKFNKNNILFGKLRPYLAKVTMPCQNGVCSGEFLVLEKISDNVLDKYVEYFLRSKSVIDLISRSTYGAKMPRAEWNFIGNIKMGFPPLCEQQKIVAYIIRKIHTIDKTIERINKEIDLITEYRTSLISAVVTGKVDVRNIEVEDSLEEIEEDVETLGEEVLEEEEISMGKEG